MNNSKGIRAQGNKVVVVIVNKAGHPIPFAGGIERYVFELFKALTKAGLRVFLISRFMFKGRIKIVGTSKLLNTPLPLWRISSEGSLLWGLHYVIGTIIYCFKAFFTAVREKANIIHVNDGFAAFLMSLLSKISVKRFRVLATIHAPPPWIISYGVKPLLLKLGYILFYIPGIKVANRVISVNPYICSALKDYQQQCVFVPNAVPKDFCKPLDEKSTKKIKEILRKYGISQRFILFVSRLVPEKGLEKLLKVYRYYRELGGKAQLVIVGRGPLESYVYRLRNIDANTIYLKYIPRSHLEALYKCTLALLVTSHAEGMPTTVLEALACGARVILYVERKLADTIRMCISDRDIKRQIIIATNASEAAAAIKALEKTHRNAVKGSTKRLTITWDIVTAKIITTYRELIEKEQYAQSYER